MTISQKRHILSDVDGTITRGSLVLDHATMLHDTGVIDLGDLPEAWRKDKKNEVLISALADGYRTKIVGMTAEQLKVDAYINSVIAGKDFYSTLVRLQDAHRELGAEVTLISGSPTFLIDAFAQKLGFSGVGSDYFTDAKGRYTGEIKAMFHADAKREHVASMKLQDTVIHAYGDTRSDVPLFEVAEWSVLVHPNQDTHDALRDSVDEVIYS